MKKKKAEENISEGQDNKTQSYENEDSSTELTLKIPKIKYSEPLDFLLYGSCYPKNIKVDTYAQFKAYIALILSAYHPEFSELDYRLNQKEHNAAKEIAQMKELGLIKSNFFTPTEMCIEDNTQIKLTDNTMRIEAFSSTFSRASTFLTKGKWYYEVMVDKGNGFSVGFSELIIDTDRNQSNAFPTLPPWMRHCLP